MSGFGASPQEPEQHKIEPCLLCLTCSFGLARSLLRTGNGTKLPRVNSSRCIAAYWNSARDVVSSREARSEEIITSFKDGSLSRVGVTLALHEIFAEPVESEPGVTGPVLSFNEIEGCMEPYLDISSSQEDEAVDSGGDADDDVDGNDQPSKRRLVFEEADLPWVKNESLVSTAPLRADLAESVRLLGVYGSDPKRALRSLLSRTRVEFPESQWLRLLTNRPVDLDAVLTGIYSISGSTAHTESVGDFDLSFNGGVSSKPTRLVVNHANANRGTAAISTSALAVARITPSPSAPSSASMAVTPPRPRYLRSFVWSDGKRHISPTALGTEIDPLFPGVPPEVFDNKALLNTVIHNPRLFRITTPIKVDLFERLLSSHPNQPLVVSFCKGLREGFWPWSQPVPGHPITLDESKVVRSDRELAFLEKTRDDELEAGRPKPSQRFSLACMRSRFMRFPNPILRS
ncbi:hypothetical protein B0H12DRAFT_1068717 [Mycena haematopus]|nr:hypothetical protein B0H12DRAFT_1068717 [Mycena haematopus]